MTHVRVFCIATFGGLVAACSGDPFRSISEENQASYPVPPVEPPMRPDPIELPTPNLGFARRGKAQVVAFDAERGTPVAELSLGRVILDLAQRGRRVFVVSSDDDLESSRVDAFELRLGEFQAVATSDAYGPNGRLVGLGARSALLTEDMAVTWTLLDEGLFSAGPSKALYKPSSCVEFERPEPLLVGLSPTGIEAGVPADTLHVTRFAGSWVVESSSLPAPDRPASFVTRGSRPGEVSVVRKATGATRFELADLGSPPALQAQPFESVDVPGANGELVAVTTEPTTGRIFALLGRGADRALLVALRSGGARAEVVTLAGPVESAWLGHELVATARRVFVATQVGVEAFELAGPREASTLSLCLDFDGAGLSAPITLE